MRVLLLEEVPFDAAFIPSAPTRRLEPLLAAPRLRGRLPPSRNPSSNSGTHRPPPRDHPHIHARAGEAAPRAWPVPRPARSAAPVSPLMRAPTERSRTSHRTAPCNRACTSEGISASGPHRHRPGPRNLNQLCMERFWWLESAILASFAVIQASTKVFGGLHGFRSGGTGIRIPRLAGQVAAQPRSWTRRRRL